MLLRAAALKGNDTGLQYQRNMATEVKRFSSSSAGQLSSSTVKSVHCPEQGSQQEERRACSTWSAYTLHGSWPNGTSQPRMVAPRVPHHSLWPQAGGGPGRSCNFCLPLPTQQAQKLSTVASEPGRTHDEQCEGGTRTAWLSCPEWRPAHMMASRQCTGAAIPYHASESQQRWQSAGPNC